MQLMGGGAVVASLTNLLKLWKSELSRLFFFWTKEGGGRVWRINMVQTALHKGAPGGRRGRKAPAPPPAAN